MAAPTLNTQMAPLEGRRHTLQRQEILETLEHAEGPLTAQQLVERTRKQMPEMDISTVYRTLKILQEGGLVRLVTLPDGVARYEKVGRGPHHFHCRECGQIWTLQNAEVASLRGSRMREGFVIEDHESTFHGKCSNCHRAR